VFDFQSQRELCQAQGRGVPMSDEIGRRGSVLPVMPTTSAVNLVIAAIPKHLAVGSPHLGGGRLTCRSSSLPSSHTGARSRVWRSAWQPAQKTEWHSVGEQPPQADRKRVDDYVRRTGDQIEMV
jgi:hypothetical protein